MNSVKKTFAILVLLTLSSCTQATPKNENTPEEEMGAPYEASTSYREYPLDAEDAGDLGFTKRAFERLEMEENLLSTGSSVLEDQTMTYVQTTEKEMANGVFEHYTWDGDNYELMSGNAGDMISDTYSMIKNDELLFEETMYFNAEGPIQDWRIVDGKPAFTFYSDTSSNDIWYDGYLISKKFSVQNPRYLFSYDGRLGFVATGSDGLDRIFYNGRFITSGFTTIWTHNCCAMLEILPTVYENRTLLFYAKRGDDNYLVETLLEESAEEAIENTAKTPEEALNSFFDALNKNEFETAVNFFDFEGQKDVLVYGTSDNEAKRLEEYCLSVPTCLRAKVLEVKDIGYDEYVLQVQFFNKDGSTYIFGPCCGASEEEMPSQDTFEFSVEKIDGLFKVTTAPLYRP